MFDNSARAAKEMVLAPVASTLERIHPTLVTGLSFILGLVGCWFIFSGWYVWGAVLIVLNRITDGLDGTMARIHSKQSDLGGYIDILADFVIYALVPIAVIFSEPTMLGYVALAFLLAAYYVNSASWMYLSAILEKRNQGAYQAGEKTTITMPPALVGGLETTLIYPIFVLAHSYAPILFFIFGGLVLLSVVQRLVWAARTL